MRIGVPKEIKVHEYRVGMTPASVREAVAHGHEVLVERNAASRQGISDADYARAGAKVVYDGSVASRRILVEVSSEPCTGSRHYLSTVPPNTRAHPASTKAKTTTKIMATILRALAVPNFAPR